MRVIRQCIRGAGNLPHVGHHPGTLWVLLLIGIGTAQGALSGWAHALFGFAIFAVSFGAIYFAGAYSRAELSDRIVKRAAE